MWDLTNPAICFGLKLQKQKSVKKHEQVYITYGERANSFLLVEYGFAIPYNQFDYLRVNNVTIIDFCAEVTPDFENRLD